MSVPRARWSFLHEFQLRLAAEPQKLKEYHDGLHKDLRDARAAVADLRKRETELVNRLTQKEKEIYALEACTCRQFVQLRSVSSLYRPP